MDNIWLKHDYEETGYLKQDQARLFINESMHAHEVSDEGFNDLYMEYGSPSGKGISKKMMARYIWKVVTEDPFAGEDD